MVQLFNILNKKLRKYGFPALSLLDLWSVSLFHFAIQQPDMQKLCSDSLI